MGLQIDAKSANDMLDAFETSIGVSPTLEILSGAQPANTGATDTGVVLATIQLPADWMLPAAAYQKAMTGTWADNAADAAGNAGHYRIRDSSNVRRLQGSCGITGSGADLELDNVVFAIGQGFSITSYVWNFPNG